MTARLFLATALLALSLSVLAGDPPNRLGDLVKQLGDERPEVRDRAEKALTEAGEPALAELDKAADAKDPELVSRARRIAEGIRQELEMKRPHDSRESWARLFAAVKPGTDLHTVARLARRASALDAEGNEGQGTVGGVSFFCWKLDPSWRLWVETDPEEPDTVKVAEVVGFEDLRPEFKDDYELCRAIQETRPFSLAFDPAACIRAVAASQAEIHAVASRMLGQEAKDPESAWVEARDRMEAENPRWDEAKRKFVRQK